MFSPTERMQIISDSRYDMSAMDILNKSNNDKVCWFPFKKAYERRRIKPEDCEDPPNVYYLKNGRRNAKPVEVSVYEYDETSSQQQAGATELILRGHPMPSQLLGLPPVLAERAEETNSLISEEDLFPPSTTASRLASINPNCMSREFWDDEIVDGGSLSCVEEFLPTVATASRSNGSGESSSRHARLTSIEKSLPLLMPPQEVTLSRDSTPPPRSRIEMEYDFSKQPPKPTCHAKPSSSMRQMDPVHRAMCGVVPGHKGNGTTDVHTRGEVSSVSNDPSSLESASDEPATRGRQAPKSTAAPQDALPFNQLGAVQQVDANPLEPPSKRLLCAVGGRKGGKDHKTYQHARGDFQNPEESHLIKGADPPASFRPSVAPSALKKASSRTESFHSRMLLGGISASKKSRNGCHLPNLASIESPQEEELMEPHFYVEVEATSKQLNEVRDLQEIQAEENPPRLSMPQPLNMELELARTASLVDEDSAFMDQECTINLLSRLSPSRNMAAAPHAVDPFDSYRKRWPDKPLLSQSPSRVLHSASYKKPLASALRTSPQIGQPLPVSVTPERQGSRQSGKSVEKAGRSTRRHREAPSQVSYNPDDAMRYVGDREIRECPSPELGVEVENYDDAVGFPVSSSAQSTSKQSTSRKISSRPRSFTTKDASTDQRMNMEAPPPSLMDDEDEDDGHLIETRNHQVALTPERVSRRSDWKPKSSATSRRRGRQESLRKSTMNELAMEEGGGSAVGEDLTTEIGQGFDVSGDHTEDFELARFPSLSTEDWKQSAIEHMHVKRIRSRIGSLDNVSAWAKPQFGGDSRDLDPHYQPNHGTAATEELNELRDFHAISRAPSLDESFDNAVPYEPDGGPESEVRYGDWDDRKASKSVPRSRSRSRRSEYSDEVIKSPRSPGQKKALLQANSWIDDDDSELNTEAFHKLAMENDEDSIFSGLVERTPAYPGDLSRLDQVEHSPSRPVFNRVTRIADGSRGSDSDNSLTERSRYTNHTAGEMSKYSKFSRGDLSKYSKYSRMSRGEMTSYTAAHSAVEEPFNCMDRWLD